MPKLGPAVAMAAALAAGAVGTARASDYSIEGDAGSIVLVAKQASRTEIVDALVKRFSLGVGGAAVGDGEVSGRYEGNLSQVLKSILPDRSYAIAYRDGRPFRISFTGTGTASAGTTMLQGGAAAVAGDTASGPSPVAALGSAAGGAAAMSSSSSDGAIAGPSPMDGAAGAAAATSSSPPDGMNDGPSPMEGGGAAAAQDTMPAASLAPTPFTSGAGNAETQQAVESQAPDARREGSNEEEASGETASSPSPMDASGTAATQEVSPSATHSAASSEGEALGISTEAPVGFKGPGFLEADPAGSEAAGGTNMASQPANEHSSRPPM